MRAAPRRRDAVLTRVLLVLLLAGTLLAGTPVAAAPAAGLAVSGNQLLRDGEPFVPRGFNMVGLLTPAWCDRPIGVAAREHFGSEELTAAASWSADTLRFQVSQRALADPRIPRAARSAYRDSVVDGVTMARDAGFVVIVSMQDQAYGCGDVHPLPSRATVDAWSALAPALMADPHVAFELFNEPRNGDDPAGWAQWRDGGRRPEPNLGDLAVGHQELVDHLRRLGATNLLVADAARLGERTTGMPRLSDPLGRLAYAIHPYFFVNGPAWWDRHYGDAAAEVPLIATEWNYLAAECGTEEEALAPDLLDYLHRHRIGVLGHAFDIPGTTIADWSWTPTECGTAVGGSGRLLRTLFRSMDEPETAPQMDLAELLESIAAWLRFG